MSGRQHDKNIRQLTPNCGTQSRISLNTWHSNRSINSLLICVAWNSRAYHMWSQFWHVQIKRAQTVGLGHRETNHSMLLSYYISYIDPDFSIAACKNNDSDDSLYLFKCSSKSKSLDDRMIESSIDRMSSITC